VSGSIGKDGFVRLAPEVLRAKVLEISLGNMQDDCLLFLSLSWIDAKEREKIHEVKTICQPRYFPNVLVLSLKEK